MTKLIYYSQHLDITIMEEIKRYDGIDSSKQCRRLYLYALHKKKRYSQES